MSEILLRRGIVDETGAAHRRVVLRALTGREEEALVAGPLDERAASELLAACVVRLGGYQQVDDRLIAELTRGDRWRLALAVRQLMNGDELVLTVTCHNGSCGELADLTLSVAELIGPEAESEAESVTVETPAGAVRLRAPVGVDDEAMAAMLPAASDRDTRAAQLWSRLVLDVGGRGPVDPDGWQSLDPETRQLAAKALLELDSILDLAFVSTCPSCGAGIEAELDPFALLERELGLGAGRLLAEVHALAFHYGWSEREVLDMPRPRRWAYLELLHNQLEGRPLVDVWS